ncbi:MAG: KaiC/GvpD/RAD55 family RecA-like ATPase [Candidatus Nanohaloarchaea archaeon]|jgi:KaiC/GvpD/RAD55 family RecA-like ATPase
MNTMECKKCGHDFPTLKALKAHVSAKHEDINPNRVGEWQEDSEVDSDSEDENPWSEFNNDDGSDNSSEEDDDGISAGKKENYLRTGINGIDNLFGDGIRKRNVTLIAGNPGSGKSIFNLHMANHAAENGEKVLFMSFEESPDALISHMEDFGWDGQKHVDDGNLVIETYDPFDVSRTVEALFKKQSGELEIDTKPLMFGDLDEDEESFDRVIVDSLSAISAGFSEKSKNYRLYVRELFDLFRDIGVTSFVIAESQTIPDQITETGHAEFLADGVILMYKQQSSRGIQIYKMRGTNFEEKIAPMTIEGGLGLNVRHNDNFFGSGNDDSGGMF